MGRLAKTAQFRAASTYLLQAEQQDCWAPDPRALAREPRPLWAKGDGSLNASSERWRDPPGVVGSALTPFLHPSLASYVQEVQGCCAPGWSV
jgi:hypothetical protein